MGTSSPTAASRPIYSIDLFCGPGGLATGLRWAGIRPIIAVEWSDRTVETYSENHGAEIIELKDFLADRATLLPYLVRTERPVIIHGDINKVTGDLVNTLLRERFGLSRVDLVTGGAPCESFSMAGDRKVDDSRNQLYQNVLRIARAAGARMFLFENVKGLFSKRMAEGARPGSMYEHVCVEFEEERDGVAYRLASRDPDEVLLHAIDYGVLQRRERLFLVGMRDAETGLSFHYPEPTHGPGREFPYVTVADAIGDLPRVGVREEETRYEPDAAADMGSPARQMFLSRMRGRLSYPPEHLHFDPASISSHKGPGHTEKMLERIRNIRIGEGMASARDRLLSEGRRDVVERCFPRKIYAARNRRLDPDKPSFTVTSHCLDEMIHPYQDRGLMPREAARLQSFPDWYAFSGPYMRFHGDAEQDRYEQIGDAIPPLLAYALGRELAASLSGRDMPEIRIEERG